MQYWLYYILFRLDINDNIYLSKNGINKIRIELLKKNIWREIIENELNNIDKELIESNLNP